MRAKIILFTAFLFLFSASGIQAHRLNVFAWLDNDGIIVRCDFGEKKPAKNAAVSVLDSVNGQVLTWGVTSNDGQYAFSLPPAAQQGHGLVIEVDAGQGHKGEWKMNAEELYAASALTAGFEAARLQETGGSANPAHPEAQAALPATEGLSETQMRAIILESLAPIHKQLALLANKDPGISEIIGGIGWIMGLVGIGLYFKSRKK